MTSSGVSASTIPAETSGGTGHPVSAALRRFGWFVLAYNVLVVLWGAVVRATGSGAGCGDHWPLCNEAAIPQLHKFHEIVEFTHRQMSLASLFLVVALLIWTWRSTARGQLARWGAVVSMVLILNEALLGALLVLFGMVNQNQSAARGVYLSVHFANTLLLLAALAITADFLTRPRARATTSIQSGRRLIPALSLFATLIVGVSGSLAALGDTLFPAASLTAAFHQDFSSTSSLLLRLRWIHPACAVIAAAFIVWLLIHSLRNAARPRSRHLAFALLALLVVQFGLGITDVLLLAPTWIQIVHLLGADLLWICLVLLTADFCLARQTTKIPAMR